VGLPGVPAEDLAVADVCGVTDGIGVTSTV
jgi:hypothetical protein